jgi:hypothetical protein
LWVCYTLVGQKDCPPPPQKKKKKTEKRKRKENGK